MPRPKTPTNILKLHGSRKAKKRQAEPQAPAKAPPQPNWFPPKAKTMWKRLIPWLRTLGVLGETDAVEMEAFCLNYCMWRDCYLNVKKNGPSLKIITREGNEVWKANPAAKLMIDFRKELHRGAQQFGLTPAARANLAIDKTKDPMSDPFTSPAGRKSKRA